MVCCVHGLSYPLEVWGPVTERLIAQGYRCIRYDLPGRGMSSFDGGALTSEALAGQTLAVLDHAEVDRAHIISLSNADLIALSLGVHAKARLRSLSLIAPSGFDARTMNLWTRLWCALPGLSTLLSRSLRARLAERMRAHQAHLPEGVPSSTREIYAIAANSVLTNPAFGAAVQSHMGHMPSRRGFIELVEAYAAKLKASREEMIRKIIDQQAVERTKCLEELKKDVQNVLQEVVQECRNEFAEQRQKDDEEDAKRRDAHAQEVLAAHARDLQKFNEQQLDGLRESMAKHRDDAMRRYQAEMAQFRDEQLAEISKLTLDGFDDGDETEDEDLGDWTDIARRAREHAGLPPDPDERLGPAHGA